MEDKRKPVSGAISQNLQVPAIRQLELQLPSRDDHAPLWRPRLNVFG
jgi:hypothetical protein